MTNIELKIWGRSLNLPVAYDWFEDEEELLPSQKEVITILSSDNQVMDTVLPNVKKYILQFNSGKNEVDNIFKYIIPQKIYVLRKEKPSFAVLCDFKFDLEHGIAIVFENNSFSKIVPQDDIL